KWLTPKGAEMSEADWNFPNGRFLAYIVGAAADSNEPLLIVLNGADETVDITGPQWPAVRRWQCVVDTANKQSNSAILELGGHWAAHPRSVLAFAGSPCTTRRVSVRCCHRRSRRAAYSQQSRRNGGSAWRLPQTSRPNVRIPYPPPNWGASHPASPRR